MGLHSISISYCCLILEKYYYGALNLLEPDLILEKYSTGNGENTVKFVENLQKKCREKIVNILGWSQASYRREYAEFFRQTK